jgi:hypothetical protein
MAIHGAGGLVGLTGAGVLLVVWSGCSGPAAMDGGSGGSDGAVSTGGESTEDGSATGGAPAAGGAGGAGGGDTSGGGASGGQSGSGGVEGSGGAVSGTCGEPPLQVMGPDVVSTEMIGTAMPTALGGPLVDGIYDAATQVFYEDFPLESLAPNFRQAIRVRQGGTLLDSFSVQQPDQSSIQSWTMAVVPSGGELEVTIVCPTDLAGDGGPLSYTASPGRIDLYVDYGATVGIISHVLRE